MVTDFTDSNNFSNYLSSFWTQFFSEELILGVSDAASRQLAQHYQDFTEAVNSSAISTIAPYHTELLYPIFVRQSELSVGPRPLTFGDGAVFGPQPSDSKFREGNILRFGERADLSPVYYIDLPDNVANTGTTLLNRLYNPSCVLVAGADFVFQDGVLILRENIFENPLVAKRTLPDSNGQVNKEIVLWATNVQIERLDLHRQYGHLFLDRPLKGEDARKALESVFKLFSNGPSIARLDSFVAAASGFPVSAEAVETVVSIDRLGSNQIVVTDLGVYSIPAGLNLRTEIKPGLILKAGSPLTTATEVNDRFSKPLWWTELDALTIGRDFVLTRSPILGFLNQDREVELTSSVLVDGQERQFCRFYLAGSNEHVDAFWKETETRSLAAGEFLAETLWTGAELVDEEGAPDYDQPLFVNPLQILNDLIGDNLIVVKVNAPLRGSIVPILKLLRETTPATCGIIVLLNISVEDSYSLASVSEDAMNPDTQEFVDPRAHYTGAVLEFDEDTKSYWTNRDSNGELLTRTPETLSYALSSDILTDTIDLGSPSILRENAAARLVPDC